MRNCLNLSFRPQPFDRLRTGYAYVTASILDSSLRSE